MQKIMVEINREQVVIEAKKYLGTPYRWQGRTQFGVDCVGFLSLVGESLGISIDYPNNYTKIDGDLITQHIKPHFDSIGLMEIKLGDILIFNIKNVPHHVGIYCDNRDLFIHAIDRNKNRGKVQIDSLDGFWGNKLSGAFNIKSFHAS